MRRSETTLLAVLGIAAIVGTVWVAQSMGDDELAERREQVRQMSAEEKARLLENKERFDRLPESEKARLRKVHEQVAADSDSDQLRGVLVRYDQWLSDLSITDSNSVRSLPPEKRVEKIKKLRQKQLQTQIDKEVREMVLTPKDWNAIRGWWVDFVKRNEAKLLAKMPQHLRAGMKNLSPERRLQRLQWMALGQRKGPGRFRQPIKPSAEDVKKLISQLSPEARERLNKIKSHDKQWQMVVGWVQSAVRKKLRTAIAPYVASKELERFFKEDLSPEVQARLKKMPEQTRRRELTKMYFKAKVHKKQGQRHPGGPHRPPHRRDGRDRRPGDKDRRPGGSRHHQPSPDRASPSR